MQIKTKLWWIVTLICLVVACGKNSSSEEGYSSDADTDADTDTDGDTDADSDSDGDSDTDTDADGDADSNTDSNDSQCAFDCLSHCRSWGGTPMDGDCVAELQCCDGATRPDTGSDTVTDAPSDSEFDDDTEVDTEMYGNLVPLEPATEYQTFEGWGTSICWWGNQIGRWSKENMNDLVESVVNPDTGLGYTVFRFNIGGGENPAHNHMT
ncbi:MAG: hypothetical protein JXR76_14990 [Deltaproteobacteria bacterium]|nr:hypothetical protein [Deltaproteobacteria bacterium]